MGAYSRWAPQIIFRSLGAASEIWIYRDWILDGGGGINAGTFVRPSSACRVGWGHEVWFVGERQGAEKGRDRDEGELPRCGQTSVPRSALRKAGGPPAF